MTNIAIVSQPPRTPEQLYLDDTRIYFDSVKRLEARNASFQIRRCNVLCGRPSTGRFISSLCCGASGFGNASLTMLGDTLSPGNIPALSTSRRSKFLIATRPEDWAAMRETPIFRLLERYIEPVYIEISPCPPGHTGCQHMGVDTASLVKWRIGTRPMSGSSHRTPCYRTAA